MLSVQEALEAILSQIAPFPPERSPLLEARGRVLAEDLFADIDNPPFDNSAVDGYAVRAEDTMGASPEHPVLLREIGEVPAGGVASESLVAGTCIRVMTGAPMPTGADAMVMREDAESGPTGVRILAAAAPGDHVRKAGTDVQRGQRVLCAGTRIEAAETAMLAAMGHANISCVRAPKVAVFSTGDELVEIDRLPGPGQIRDSNRYTLAALVHEAGATLHSMRHLPDDPAATAAAFRTAAGLDGGEPADVIVTSGGVSVGDRDYVKPALERLGTLELWRVKMKPGKPLAFGRIGNTHFFGLPGNPVSTMVTWELFVRRALWKLAGRTDLARPTILVRLTEPVSHASGREEYVRGTVTWSDGAFQAIPTGAQGSGALTSMLGANALLILAAERGDYAAGETVHALLLGPLRTSTAPQPHPSYRAAS